MSASRWASGARLAKAQGVFNVVGGLWPVVWLRSFEAIYGPRKRDTYLQMASGGQFAATGVALLNTSETEESVKQARAVGLAAATTYLAIDLVYVARGEIHKTYLLDALFEIGWIYAWWRWSNSEG